MFICALCVLLFALRLECAFPFKPCATPDGKEGACTQVADCLRIKALLQQQSLNDDELAFVQQSQVECRNAETETEKLVCCQASNRSNLWKRSADEDEEDPLPHRCKQGEVVDKITDGNIANIDEYPWMALLKYKTLGGQYGYGCAGALINKRYVLTAAHCVVGKHGPPVEVTLGEYDVNTPTDCTRQLGVEECTDPPQDIPVEEVTKHPEYVKDARNKLHDIALIRLQQAATYTEFTKPICIPTQEIHDDIVKPNAVMNVAGWGRTRLREASNIKMKAKVPIVDAETCSVNRTIKIAPSQICAGGLKQDSCTGDSGGPLMGQHAHGRDNYWYICGIVSFGPSNPCGQKHIASVYTNVIFYRDWIIQSIKP